MYCANQRKPSPYPCRLRTEHINSSNGRPGNSDRETFPYKDKAEKLAKPLETCHRLRFSPFLLWAGRVRRSFSIHPRWPRRAYQSYFPISVRGSWRALHRWATNPIRFCSPGSDCDPRHRWERRWHQLLGSSLSTRDEPVCVRPGRMWWSACCLWTAPLTSGAVWEHAVLICRPLTYGAASFCQHCRGRGRAACRISCISLQREHKERSANLFTNISPTLATKQRAKCVVGTHPNILRHQLTSPRWTSFYDSMRNETEKLWRSFRGGICKVICRRASCGEKYNSLIMQLCNGSDNRLRCAFELFFSFSYLDHQKQQSSEIENSCVTHEPRQWVDVSNIFLLSPKQIKLKRKVCFACVSVEISLSALSVGATNRRLPLREIHIRWQADNARRARCTAHKELRDQLTAIFVLHKTRW